MLNSVEPQECVLLVLKTKNKVSWLLKGKFTARLGSQGSINYKNIKVYQSSSLSDLTTKKNNHSFKTRKIIVNMWKYFN